MRLYLQLSKNRAVIPFNYQSYLTGAIHKWMGRNNSQHDSLSLYSFSWFQNVETSRTGVNLTKESYFFISGYEESLIKQILQGVMDDPSVCYGSSVTDVQITNEPSFQSAQTFFTASPVFIKRRIENNEKHFTYENPASSLYLTETLKKKLEVAQLSSEGITVRFDDTYANPRTRIIRYNDIGNRVSVCPITIEGTPDQLQFAWNVGVGNSTGIGFGSLK